MNFINSLNKKLNALHLLNHQYYQSWNMGELTISNLQTYAQEYYHHVAAFPRYISAIHSRCNNLKMRQVLLDNLIEEEKGEENHPELWQRFTEGLGGLRASQAALPKITQTKALVDGYFKLVETDYATGLGALYAYERQTPEVSKSKIDGLKKFYDVTDERTLKFFEVHMEADEWHSDEVASLIAALSPADREKAARGAETGARLLWGFLDGMMMETQLPHS